MALIITHAKVINTTKNPDIVQADVDALIAEGKLAATTLVSEIALGSDFNTNHTITGALPAGVVIKPTITESSATADAGKRVYCSNGSAVTYTIEPSSTADLGSDATFRLQAGAGGITIAAGAGVTLVGSTTVAAYDCITCDRDGVTETWYL
jgi:hypothetical protein